MKQRFYLYKRGDRYYMQDARTGKQQALGTTDKGTALRLLEVKRQSVADPAYNQFILKSLPPGEYELRLIAYVPNPTPEVVKMLAFISKRTHRVTVGNSEMTTEFLIDLSQKENNE